VGIFGAEPWTQSMRPEIERRMGLQALDIYGLSEIMGPGGAGVHPTKDGLTSGRITSTLKSIDRIRAFRE